MFVGAANADQLATRLIAVQNVGEAKKSLTTDGVDNIRLGQSGDDIRKTHNDFPDINRAGKVVVVYADCDFGFIDDVLDSITPHGGAAPSTVSRTNTVTGNRTQRNPLANTQAVT